MASSFRLSFKMMWGLHVHKAKLNGSTACYRGWMQHGGCSELAALCLARTTNPDTTRCRLCTAACPAILNSHLRRVATTASLTWHVTVSSSAADPSQPPRQHRIPSGAPPAGLPQALEHLQGRTPRRRRGAQGQRQGQQPALAQLHLPACRHQQ